MSDHNIPEGFEALPEISQFSSLVGPFLVRRGENGDFELGLHIDQKHLNGQGFCHGGVMMTMADSLLGSTVWRKSDGRPCATLSLNTDFIGNLREGDFVIGKAEVTRLARSVAFVQGRLYTPDGKNVMTATGVWKFFDQS